MEAQGSHPKKKQTLIHEADNASNFSLIMCFENIMFVGLKTIIIYITQCLLYPLAFLV